MTGHRQVSLDATDATDATSVAVALSGHRNLAAPRPDDVIAGLAASAYGEPTPRGLAWARELISDLRYYSAVLSFAIGAAGPGGEPAF